jgi:Tol biopolymer transport system component
VADFGIALAASRSEGAARMTETGMSLGTPAYMAPEQAMGERDITPRADIYALGATLYEMLSGEPPFVGPTAQAIIARVMTEEPRALTLHRHTIPPHIEAAVRKALEKLPADRFASAAQLVEALDKPGLVTLAEPPATRAMPVAGAPAWGWRGRVSAVAPWAAAAVFAVLAAVRWLAPGASPAAPARFAVPLGSIRSANLSPRISPDGFRIAFTGVDSTGTERVYIRSLDREDPVGVPGTEGAQNSPQFSPDGRWLLFRQGNKLRRIAITGGAVSIVCDLAGGQYGVAWGARDQIVFVRSDTVFVVPASGGQVRPLIVPDSAAGVTAYRSFSFLPDGEHFVAERVTARGSDLVVLSTAGGAATPLGLSGITPQYAGGRLVYADGIGAVFAAPFDPARRKVTGPAERLIERVAVNVGFARMGVSASGIVYFAGTSIGNRQLLEVDRAGREHPLAVRPAAYRYPRYSPDGRRIAVGVVGSGFVFGDIWVYDVASQRLSRVTLDTLSGQPEWSPDGKSLMYSHFDGGIWDLYRTAADGSTDAQRFFSRRPSSVWEPRVLPNGHLLFREDAARTSRSILEAPVDSPAAARPLAATEFNERALALSPDSKWIAFVSNLSGSAAVYIRRLDQGSARWRVSPGNGTEPRWGPGGREIFYRLGDTVLAVAVALGTEPTFGQPKALFVRPYAASANEALYDVSRDGQRFLMVRELGGESGLSLHIVINPFTHGSAGSTAP